MKKVTVLFFIAILFFSCDNKDVLLENRWKYFIGNHSSEEKDKILSFVKDTVGNWVHLNVLSFSPFRNKKNIYEALDFVFFNSKRNKCLIYFLMSYGEIGYKIDNITVILGEKYEGNWWFYPGPTYAILRKHYGNSKKEPVPIKKLKKTARRIAMGWYYKEERKSFGDCNNFLLEFDFDGYNQCRKLNYTIHDAAFKESMFEVARYYYPKFLKEKYMLDKKRDVI